MPAATAMAPISCRSGGEGDEEIDALVKMLESSCHASDATYDALIKACSHYGNVAQAEDLFWRMQELGHTVSVNTYNAMIHTCNQAGDLATAEHYLEALRNSGIEPNLITYNSMMNAYVAQGDMEHTELYFREMVARGVRPNEVTYGTLCKCFGHRGDVQAVQLIMDALESAGMTLNEYFYASLFSACASARPMDVATADKAFRKFIRQGLKLRSVKKAVVRVLGDLRTSAALAEFDRGGSLKFCVAGKATPSSSFSGKVNAESDNESKTLATVHSSPAVLAFVASGRGSGGRGGGARRRCGCDARQGSDGAAEAPADAPAAAPAAVRRSHGGAGLGPTLLGRERWQPPSHPLQQVRKARADTSAVKPRT